MFLINCQTNDVVEILDPQALYDFSHDHVNGRYHAGEELQDAQLFAKSNLMFLSGEKLPECWTNKDYKSNVHL